ncbi:MAG: tetratricopeptide repeat protein [Candidatus Melainabacteria bacterium]|nr:tetratricopeptide repeat protein [Candidatus Melainabacteria bacterium]
MSTRLLFAIVSELVLFTYCVTTVLAQDPWTENTKAARAAFNQGNFEQAEKLNAQALKIAETFGEGDPRLTASLRGLAQCILGWPNKDDEILRLLLREQKIMRTLGEDFPGRIDGMVLLGRAYSQANKPGEAEKCFKDALALCGPVSAGRVSNVDIRQSIFHYLGECYMTLGRSNDAERCLKTCLAELDGQRRATRSTCSVCRELGEVFYKSQRYDESKNYLKRCLEVDDSQLGEKSADEKTAVYARLGEIYDAQGNSDEALRYLNMAVASGENIKNNTDFVMESLFPHIAKLELARGHRRQCLAAASKALKMAEGKYPVKAAEIRLFQASVLHSHAPAPGEK